jgi:hypothetical protein
VLRSLAFQIFSLFFSYSKEVIGFIKGIKSSKFVANFYLMQIMTPAYFTLSFFNPFHQTTFFWQKKTQRKKAHTK